MMGIILVRILNSSTCVTVQTLPGSGVDPLGRIAALSNNLITKVDCTCFRIRIHIVRIELKKWNLSKDLALDRLE